MATGCNLEAAFPGGLFIFQERWRNILARLGPGSLEGLDIGTGTGFVALILAELGHRATGVDWSVTMLDQARAKARERGLEIAFVEGGKSRWFCKTPPRH